ncbi:hypothetical protein NFI96_026693 [Prochilodus magdalenae]|nr:hypothetical protein NFI96_026693 [Prochilodus magdalenae]
MPRHLISDAHEWMNEIPTVPTYYLAKPQPRERAWQNQRGKKTLLSLTLVYPKTGYYGCLVHIHVPERGRGTALTPPKVTQPPGRWACHRTLTTLGPSYPDLVEWRSEPARGRPPPGSINVGRYGWCVPPRLFAGQPPWGVPPMTEPVPEPIRERLRRPVRTTLSLSEYGGCVRGRSMTSAGVCGGGGFLKPAPPPPPRFVPPPSVRIPPRIKPFLVIS